MTAVWAPRHACHVPEDVPYRTLRSTPGVPACRGGKVFGGVPQGEWRVQDNLNRRGGPCLGLFPWPRFPSYPQAR